MAQTDPADNQGPIQGRFSFKGWLNGITSFFNGGSQRTIVSGKSSLVGGTIPVLAQVAKNQQDRADRSYNGGLLFLSRQERAKRKNQVWENDLSPLVWEKLQRQFHPQNFNRMKLDPHLATNVMRRIVEDISIAYESPAKRRLIVEKKTEQTQSAVVDSAAPVIPSKVGPAVPAAQLDTGDPNIDALAEQFDLEGNATDEAAEKDSNDPDDVFERIMKLADIDLVMDLVEKKCRIHECVWVRPYVTYENHLLEADGTETGDPDSAKFKYVLYDPSNADVVEDPETGDALAWYYFGTELDDHGKAVTRIHFWTDDVYFKFDEQWRPLEQSPNDLGRLPVACFRKEQASTSCYYAKGVGDDLYEATLALCTQRTIQDARFRDSAFKQLALIDVNPDDVPADQVMGGPTPIYVPAGGSAAVLDMQPNLQPMSDMVRDRFQEIASTYGISAADFKADGGPQSGFAKKLDRDRVLKENRRIRKFLAEGEKDLWHCTAVTLNLYKIGDIPEIDPSLEFEIDFAEPSFQENPKEQNSIDEQAMRLHAISIVDVLARENPDLSEVELIKLAYKNKAINSAFSAITEGTLQDILAYGVGKNNVPPPGIPIDANTGDTGATLPAAGAAKPDARGNGNFGK